METQNHHYKILIIIVFLVLAVFITILAYSRFAKSPTIVGNMTTRVTAVPSPVKPAYGSITIKSGDSTDRHPVTDYLNIVIYLDSAGVDVVGYDSLINYDVSAFQLIQAESSLADFSLFKISTMDGLTVTGSKKLSTTGSTILSNSKIVTLTLKPQKTGRFTFGIIGEKGKEKTQFVDVNSKTYYPKQNEIKIEIY